MTTILGESFAAIGVLGVPRDESEQFTGRGFPSRAPVAHGAPQRLRVERQLGYKMAKYVVPIEAIDSFEGLSGGRAAFGKAAAKNGMQGFEAGRATRRRA